MNAPSASSHSGRSDRLRPRGPRLRIFVVENHDDTRMLLCLLLERLGHTVHSAATLREALHAIPASHSDVLISDIGLPDGDGWELMRRLGDQRPAFAIAMSGRGLTGDYERSRAAGFRHHLLKPAGPDQIAELLDRAAVELKREPQTA